MHHIYHCEFSLQTSSMRPRICSIFLLGLVLVTANEAEDSSSIVTSVPEDVTTVASQDVTTKNNTGFQGDPVQEGTPIFVVSVRMNDKHVNVGTIISSEHVLTEAWHYGNCSSTPCNVTIRFNAVDVLNGGETRSAVEVTAHENYTHPHFDLAIIKVSPPFSTEQLIASLPSSNQTWPPETEATTFAWGGFANEFLTTLRVDKYDVLKDEDCANLEDWYPEEQICTKSQRPGSGLCDGDYGAPLIVNDSMIIGLNIFNSGGGDTAPPDRFLNLVPFLPWINDQISPKIHA